jgi:hypothetical protein
MSETSAQRRREYAQLGLSYHEFQVEDNLYGVCVNADNVSTPLTVADRGVIWLRTMGRKLYPKMRQEQRDRETFFTSLGIEPQVQLDSG